MRIYNTDKTVPNPALVTALQNYMQGKTDIDARDVRQNVPALSNATDGELDWIARAAGMTTGD